MADAYMLSLTITTTGQEGILRDALSHDNDGFLKEHLCQIISEAIEQRTGEQLKVGVHIAPDKAQEVFRGLMERMERKRGTDSADRQRRP